MKESLNKQELDNEINVSVHHKYFLLLVSKLSYVFFLHIFM